MLWFWIAAALLSAGAATLIAQRAAAGARRRGAPGPELALYRRQMAEIDDLAERGLLAEPERRGVRAETGRRLLAAAQRADAPVRAAGLRLVLGLAAIAPLAGVGAYLAIGSPGFADQPFARRLAEWRAADPASLTPLQMAAVLRAIAAERPGDPEPLRNLALAELASDQPMEAAQALERAIALAPRRADLWAGLGQAEVAAANGEVGDDARQAFGEALTLDPGDADARYFLARARIADGDVGGGLADWRALQSDLPAGDARKSELGADIAEVAASGALPAGPGGAGLAQVQAMVDGLAARLKAQPDDPAGWVRLVRAYAVLGEADRRDAALAEARRRFATRADVLAQLQAATRPPS